MRHLAFLAFVAASFSGLSSAYGQQPPPPAAERPFVAGQPLETTPNARTYGGFGFAESVSYDPKRDLYVVPSAGMAQQIVPTSATATS